MGSVNVWYSALSELLAIVQHQYFSPIAKPTFTYRLSPQCRCKHSARPRDGHDVQGPRPPSDTMPYHVLPVCLVPNFHPSGRTKSASHGTCTMIGRSSRILLEYSRRTYPYPHAQPTHINPCHLARLADIFVPTQQPSNQAFILRRSTHHDVLFHPSPLMKPP